MSSSVAQQQQLEWSESSLRQQQQHQEMLRQMHVSSASSSQKHANITVPTLPHQVRDALRQMALPVRLFGENLATIRDRLRMALAIRQQEEDEETATQQQRVGGAVVVKKEKEQEEEEEVTKYSRASAALVEARTQMAHFSLDRARLRLERERRLRTESSAAAKKKKKNKRKNKSSSSDVDMDIEDDDSKRMIGGGKVGEEDLEEELLMVDKLDQQAAKTLKQLRHLALQGSQYCDHRALSSLKVVHVGGDGTSSSSSSFPVIVAGSWTASLHLLNRGLESLGTKTQCHEDRIMGIDATTASAASQEASACALIATASLDKTAKLFKVEFLSRPSGSSDDDDHNNDNDMEVDETDDTKAGDVVNNNYSNNNSSSSAATAVITELCHFKGHAARLCRVAFHPMNRHVATTSFDHTWRLWDMERTTSGTEGCLLLQDGHARECYGIGFHPDGSLVSTTDLGGIVHVWDLRVGKSIAWYRSHAGKVLNTEFHPNNGFQMATAGEDGCIHIWDLRRRGSVKTNKSAAGQNNKNNINPQQSSSPLFSIPAHNNIVTKLQFDPSGEFLCSSSFDGLVKLWSCRTWKLINQLRGHEGKVTGVDVLLGEEEEGGGGGFGGVITSGFDKTIKLWR